MALGGVISVAAGGGGVSVGGTGVSDGGIGVSVAGSGVGVLVGWVVLDGTGVWPCSSVGRGVSEGVAVSNIGVRVAVGVDVPGVIAVGSVYGTRKT